jgi:uncharacterized protein YjiK
MSIISFAPSFFTEQATPAGRLYKYPTVNLNSHRLVTVAQPVASVEQHASSLLLLRPSLFGLLAR